MLCEQADGSSPGHSGMGRPWHGKASWLGTWFLSSLILFCLSCLCGSLLLSSPWPRDKLNSQFYFHQTGFPLTLGSADSSWSRKDPGTRIHLKNPPALMDVPLFPSLLFHGQEGFTAVSMVLTMTKSMRGWGLATATTGSLDPGLSSCSIAPSAVSDPSVQRPQSSI